MFGQGFQLPMTVDAKTVSDEIVAAFRDVPRPDRCAPEDFVADDEAEDLDYLSGKTWLDIAADVTYMNRHHEDQFFYMTRECLFYLLPGYLLGVVNHKHELAKGVVNSLLRLLNPNPSVEWQYELSLYLAARFNPIQKKAVAHWHQLELERDRERRPERYESGRTEYQAAFDQWRKWA
jgi:hypothetical protein